MMCPRAIIGTIITERTSELANGCKMLRAAGLRGEKRVGHVGHELGFAGANDLRQTGRGVGVERIARSHLAHAPQLWRVDVRGRELLDLATDEHVDAAPVGEVRHGKPGRRGHGRLVVERRRENAARLVQQPEPLGMLHGIPLRMLRLVECRSRSAFARLSLAFAFSSSTLSRCASSRRVSSCSTAGAAVWSRFGGGARSGSFSSVFVAFLAQIRNDLGRLLISRFRFWDRCARRCFAVAPSHVSCEVGVAEPPPEIGLFVDVASTNRRASVWRVLLGRQAANLSGRERTRTRATTATNDVNGNRPPVPPVRVRSRAFACVRACSRVFARVRACSRVFARVRACSRVFARVRAQLVSSPAPIRCWARARRKASTTARYVRPMSNTVPSARIIANSHPTPISIATRLSAALWHRQHPQHR